MTFRASLALSRNPGAPTRRSCIIAALTAGLLAVAAVHATASAEVSPSPLRVVFATYAEGPDQARKARVLIRSIRTFSGAWRDAPVFIAADPDASDVLAAGRAAGETVLRLDLPAVARTLPFAAKVYAAAQVERLVERDADAMIWLDPESLVLAPPGGLMLTRGAAVALQPVFLLNKVGVPAGEAFPPYWKRIFDEVGADPATVPTVRAVVDDRPIRFYVNCGVIAYRPSKRIGEAWARTLTALLSDPAYRAVATADGPHAVFLHQAVLSAVLCARTRPSERQWIPISHGYPLNLADRVPVTKKVSRLNDLVCLIYDTVWDQDPDWISRVPVDEPLRGWLLEAYRSLHRAGSPAGMPEDSLVPPTRRSRRATWWSSSSRG
jgi:hypothetical protein